MFIDCRPNLTRLKKIGIALTPIITPGSPPPPQLAGRRGIPSPNPGRAINNRGGPDTDFVARSPRNNASDGVRYSSLPTEQKQASALGASMAQVGIPALVGAGLGFMANKEKRLAGSLLGGATGAALGLALPRVGMLKSITPFTGLTRSKLPDSIHPDMKEAVRRVLTAKEKVGKPSYKLTQKDVLNLLSTEPSSVKKILNTKSMEDAWGVYERTLTRNFRKVRGLEQGL